MRGGGRKGSSQSRPPVVLVFGEGNNDREVLVALVRALAPEVGRVEERRAPLILQKNPDEAKRRKNAVQVARLVNQERIVRSVPFVVAHQDCDDYEPAHVALSDDIETCLNREDVLAVAATPAWEMEAWLYLWPDAVSSVNPKWRRLRRRGDVGRIANAKESLIRDLRPPSRHKVRDYEEADSVRIVKKAIELGVIEDVKAASASYNRFVVRLASVVAQTLGSRGVSRGVQ